jgi:hypothetical protein
MLKSYFLEVKAGDRTLNRFEVRLALDVEAIQHSKELAATIRHRHFNNHPGLLIEFRQHTGTMNERAQTQRQSQRPAYPLRAIC